MLHVGQDAHHQERGGLKKIEKLRRFEYWNHITLKNKAEGRGPQQATNKDLDMSSSTPGTSAKNKKKIEKTKEEDENQEGSRKIEFKKKENLPKNKSVDKPATSCTLKTVEDTYLWEAEDWDLGKLIRNQEEVSCESSSSSLGSVPSSSSS